MGEIWLVCEVHEIERVEEVGLDVVNEDSRVELVSVAPVEENRLIEVLIFSVVLVLDPCTG